MFYTKEPLTLKQVKEEKFERPKRAGGRFKPLFHGVLVDFLKETLTPILGQVAKEEYTLGVDNLNCVGCLWFQPQKQETQADFICVGFTNNNDLQKPLKVYTGYEYLGVGFVVDCVSAGARGLNNPLEKTLQDVADIAEYTENEVNIRHEEFRSRTVSGPQRAFALMKMVDENFLAPSRAYTAFGVEDDTVMGAYTSFAAQVRRGPPFTQFAALEAYHDTIMMMSVKRISDIPEERLAEATPV